MIGVGDWGWRCTGVSACDPPLAGVSDSGLGSDGSDGSVGSAGSSRRGGCDGYGMGYRRGWSAPGGGADVDRGAAVSALVRMRQTAVHQHAVVRRSATANRGAKLSALLSQGLSNGRRERGRQGRCGAGAKSQVRAPDPARIIQHVAPRGRSGLRSNRRH